MDIQSEIERVQSFVDSGNYHAAFNIAISALNECRREGDQTGVDTFLGVMRKIARVMEQEFASEEYLEGRE